MWKLLRESRYLANSQSCNAYFGTRSNRILLKKGWNYLNQQQTKPNGWKQYTHQLQLTLTLWSPVVTLDNHSDTQQIDTLSLSQIYINEVIWFFFGGFNIMFIFIQSYVCWLQNQLNNIVQSFVFVFFIVSYP